MKRYLVATILMSAVPLFGCGGYDGPEEEQISYGVTVTDNVPFAQETIQDIIDRENQDPLPQKGDREMPDHHM